MPILLAPKIFGSCFQLFKILGMFARANYYIFLPCNYTEKISFVRHEYVSERTEDHQLIELNDLLENVIPKYLIAFKEKHNHVSSEACSIFMCDNHELSVECCDLSQRLEGLSAFLRQLKSTKIDGLRNIVKKWLSLFNDLNK
ncbi:hypothetical protein A3K48_01765 [candidate division WOR-1 bacterium RIFOXYA12_FULL_52_29]|uniref:Uncharacterized protein n=1 Tax=candidate division WOR-1 bacterium RIFOXYC12_FULL_54_18 TaxID=1802584 RepID=A0A1F4T584_UNCSA|nr:MAG: hypothetical protein A3K44_01765 [candidate division WOR-1 bacterium RIFOXYA2_FULL_51_19]OGC17309.1 MAG: hypothetical protein A3K48_01765 [candidate division WOR-1 bacterium RIFOXYA12_FULL_52_29]OGC26169.1 MAG: hypothetical protein A3K32_01760 [candidate division WOR-1 bacterium RIFOXYB2_FULL_45_9]OGC27726.1 MAG: hypothetical protein A3K49_01765 [candidate division WOR-1 bacterium RIFOXYC12_FULL_54_18]OGC29983.1 MAG: hypothetical protein A2346_04570 [candidate division WOR-1 bacterium R